MKSIICEASSIAKAVDQGWKKAGMPQNFSVKVLEQEEKNFLGMTKKPAKVAIFFEEKFEPQRKKPEARDNRDNRDSRDNKPYEKNKSLSENLKGLHEGPQKNIQPKPQTQIRPIAARPLQQATTIKTQPTQTPRLDIQENIVRKSPWTQEMVSVSSKWVEDMLLKMNLKEIKFLVEVNNNNIRFHFEKSLVENKNEQKELFRNFAFLLMQTLRYKFKKQFKNLKAVFTSNI